MTTWFPAIFRWLVAALVAATLAACGGGKGGEQFPPAAPAETFVPAQAVPTDLTIDNRKVILAVPVGNLTLTAAEAELTFMWAQKWDKGTLKTFFTDGPTTQTGVFGGEQFVFRDYPSGASIRIRLSDGAVFVQWPDKSIRQHGWLARDYYCQLHDCVAPATAGEFAFSADASGTSVWVKPNLKGNLITALGAEVNGVGTGFEIPAEDVEEVCVYSDRFGNWGTRGGRGCNKPMADGSWRVTWIPNNDGCMQVVAWTKSAQLLWLDHKATRGWKVTGLNAVAETCGVSYGAKGFTPARIDAVREADGTASLVWNTGSNYAGGWPATFDLADRTKTYAFVLNGDRQGANYGSGWGLGAGRKTTDGFAIAPSVKMAWLELNADGQYVVKFKNLACTDRVNATAYVGTGPANNVVYATGADGFGLGWAGLPSIDPKTGQVTKSFWTAGVGVFFDPIKSQLQYGVPFCTQK